ncbi:MAG: hypothetical protein IJA58_01070 [Lachnospiraceae bacterium]|nr:hypothetical protein [Lachnospiraceae bacterium]
MRRQMIDQAELTELMRFYFMTVARLLRWKADERRCALEEKILDLILAIRGKTEYREACMEILDVTNLIQTMTDCAMIKLGGNLIRKDQCGFFELKAEALRAYQVNETMAFDPELMMTNNREAVTAGDTGALRLGAVLAWLGVDREASRETAIRHWQVLAYTGDYFAMQALEHAYRYREDDGNTAKWRKVQEICKAADRQFTFTVPAIYLRKADDEAVDTAQLILAVRSRCAEQKKEMLPLPLLRYAIESTDDLSVKLRNLYAEPAVYHVLLIQQSRIGHKQYGF